MLDQTGAKDEIERRVRNRKHGGVSRDRGEFVRRREDYVRLAEGCFARVESFVRHDLLRIPYTHLIMRSHKGG